MNQNLIRILIVEDEKIVAMDMRHNLLGMGYEVAAMAATGEEAVEAAVNEKPDLVLMDIFLAGKMNGIEAARLIQEHHDVPIVYVTAHSDEKTFKEAKLTGPFGYVIKPFEDKDLRIAIEVALYKFRMEIELKESRRRFREVFLQNVDAIVLLRRPNFTVIDANPTAEHIFQYPKEALIRDFTVLFQDDEHYQVFRRALQTFPRAIESPFLDRCLIRRRDGADIMCSVKINLIHIDGTEVFYCSFRDETEKVRIEQETRELHSKLIRANKMASLGTLASGVAHEINNPNNFILSNAQIVEQIWGDAAKFLRRCSEDAPGLSFGGLPFGEAEEVVPRLLLDIIEGARRIRNITNSLRDFARPRDEHIREKVSIEEVLDFSVSMLSTQLKQYTHAFSCRVEDNIPLFWGNPQQLEQVVINLLQNALYALPDPSRAVRVAARYQAPTREIILEVADEGVGMEKSVLDRVVDPFFTTRQTKGGTGLGLYISYAIIKKHKGAMEFQSEPGSGTKVTVKLPVSGEEEAEHDGR